MAKYIVNTQGQVTSPQGAIVSPQQQAQAQQQVIQQIANNTANQQLQNQAQAQQQKQEQDPLRGLVNQMIENKLVEKIETPRFSTIQDIFKAPAGEKFNTFGQYLNSPSGQNLIGGVLGLLTGGKLLGSPQDDYTNYLYSDMGRKQATAMKQMQEQNDIATALNNAYNQRDIADENNKRMRELAEMQNQWQREKFAQELEIEKARFNAQRQHQRNMEAIGWYNAKNRGAGGSGGGSATGGAVGTGNKKLSAAEIKQIQKNQEALNSLNAVQGQLDRFSDSFNDVRPTKLGALMAGAVASKGFGNTQESNFNAQRTLLFNKIARELGGEKGVLSDQDIKRIESSLPSLSDSLPQKKAKMQAIYNLLDDRKTQYGGAISRGMASQANDPMGLGL